MDSICKCGCLPEWGIGTFERISEYRIAQKELNNMYKNALDGMLDRPDPDMLDLYPADKTPFSEIAQKIRDNSDGYEWWKDGAEPILYPEEVRSDAMEAQLKREMAKGRVYGHFC